MAQFGSALGSGPRGRRFKSCHSDQKITITISVVVIFFQECKELYLITLGANQAHVIHGVPKKSVATKTQLLNIVRIFTRD